MFELEISEDELRQMAGNVERQLWMVKSDAQLAMAEAFERVTLANFGATGIDRPMSWQPLSPAYARKVGRTYATLEVSGTLKAAIKVDNSDLDHSKVSVSNADVPYATAHHFGNERGNLPQRPYFPIDDNGNLTPFTEAEVVEAARRTIERGLE
jgi:phage gpG-like protein